MKPILLTCAVSLAIGFTAGWMIKSADSKLESFRPEGSSSKAIPSSRPNFDPEPSPSKSDRPLPEAANPDNSVLPEETPVPESAKRLDQAKWQRLMETLNLTPDQAKTIEANIEQIRPDPTPDESPDAAYERTGKELENKILSILNPEQQAAFKEYQQRALENRVETKAQEAFGTELGGLDLTPSQREQALELLRQNAANEEAQISSGTRLMLSGSILPIGNEKLSEDGILLLRKLKIGNGPGSGATMESLAKLHRAEIEEKLERFKGILTPAQLEYYKSGLGESLENLDVISSEK